MSSALKSCPKLLVVGSNGMLGRDLLERVDQDEWASEGLDLPDLDITSLPALLSSIETVSPDIIINCAAYTAVDKAESEPDMTFAVNRDGSGNLADACLRMSIPLIHLSTDYVFDGNADRPYHEDDRPNPVGVYGRSKLEGETAIRSRWAEHIIVRTAWLYGRHGSNFAKTMLWLASERDEIRVVDDQTGCPTWTGDLADALIHMARMVTKERSTVQWGTYHFCGAGQTSWYEFARLIISEARRNKLLSRDIRLTPIRTVDYPTPASRPAWSVLDCGKLASSFGIKPRPWEMGLKDMMVELTM